MNRVNYGNKIQFGLLTFFIVHIFYVQWSYYPKYETLKLVFLLCAAVLLIPGIKVVVSREFRTVNLCAMLFLLSAFVSSFINKGRINGALSRGLVYIFIVAEIIVYIEEAIRINRINTVVEWFYKYSFLYILISDLLMLAIPSLYSSHGNTYFVGNKFTLGYLHLFLLGFFCYRYRYNLNRTVKLGVIKKTTIVLWLIVGTAIFINIQTACSTALVSVFIILVLLLFRFTFDAKKWIIILGVSDTILLAFSTIVMWKPFQYLIVNVLGESLDLHDRLRIYQDVIPLILKNPIWGYGARNVYNLLFFSIQAPNAQNGILNNIVQFGIVGTVLLVLTLFIMLSKGKNCDDCAAIWILVIWLTIISAIEITISYEMVFLCALIMGIAIEKSHQEYQNG